jgi:hypothetical protein
MRTAFLLIFLLLTANFMLISAQTARELAELWDKEHVSHIFPSNVRHKDLQKYLEGLRKHGLKIDEVGRSYAGREIYQIEWGKGPLKIFLWSQMHGDEPTATSALIDIFTVLRTNADKEWVKQLETAVTIRAVPMLNPDGAELYIRRNLQGIDINRDARDLKTPEAQLLKKLRDEWSPNVGFNLHNQNALTTVGSTSKQAAISLLVVYGDEAKTPSEGHDRNKRVVGGMIDALNNFIPGNIGRYDDDYTASAFGDNFSAWGTPVILIETGALFGQDEMYLVKMNFVAIVTALRSFADGTEKNISPVAYDTLPANSSGRIVHIVFRGGNIVTTAGVKTADLALVRDRRRAEFTQSASVRQIGDLSRLTGLEEYDASGHFIYGRVTPIAPGGMGELLFYKKDRQIDWNAADVERQFPPDAIFSTGKWVKGGELFKCRTGC